MTGQVLVTEPSAPKPTLGRVVHYTMSAADAQWCLEHLVQQVGNAAREGQVLAATVCAVFDGGGTNANLAVQLDGVSTYWATSRPEGTEPGTWRWPPRS